MDGMNQMAVMAKTKPSAATAKKGARQPKRPESSSPAGTPSTDAIENAPMTAPMALPRRAGGMASAITASDREVAGPPNAPATTRATSSVPSPLARPPMAVPTTRPSMATPSATRRSKRSRNSEPTTPAIAAAAV
jgi:hypothetical protein